jgi:hypothetical protein
MSDSIGPFLLVGSEKGRGGREERSKFCLCVERAQAGRLDWTRLGAGL